jgi:thiol-disulfide isomerase/thioredoxin
MNRRKFVVSGLAALLASAQMAQAAPSGLGIIFVAQSTCPYCAAIAPILAQLRDEAGVDVILASMDGAPLPPFMTFEDGRQNPLTAHYPAVPQVLIYSERLGRVTHEIGGVRTLRHFINQLSFALRQAAVL